MKPFFIALTVLISINSYAQNSKSNDHLGTIALVNNTQSQTKIKKKKRKKSSFDPDKFIREFDASCTECLKIQTEGHCQEQVGAGCTISAERIKTKQNELKDFGQIVITSALDGRYFKSGKSEFTILNVEYPGVKCDLAKDDVAYIVATLQRDKARFIKVYNLEKDIYCDLMY